MKRVFMPVLAAFIAAHCGVAAHAQPADPPNAGTTQANADLTAGMAPKLYYHYFNGVFPSIVVPGVDGCQPQLAGREGQKLFAHLREADVQEGSPPVSGNLKGGFAAWQFAKSYNREMLRLRRAAILRICPQAHLRSDRD